MGHLFEQVTTYENLLMAAKLAKRGCGSTAPACRFFYWLEPELLRLQRELRQGTYRPGLFHYFTIRDPKPRLIAVAPFRDRVVHHAVVRILTPIYERVFIFDSYATRAGKGQHAAIRRAQRFLRQSSWYLKADVEHFFDRIDHDLLLRLLCRKIKDPALLALLETIVRHAQFSGNGLPIGNLTSQFLANVYLDPLDHAIKDQWGVKGYVRYMDDVVLFSRNKWVLLDYHNRIEDFLTTQLALTLKPNVTCINRASHGLSFLGMRIFPRLLRLKPENRQRSLKKLRKTIDKWQCGRLNEQQMQDSLTSCAAHLRYFCPAMRLPTFRTAN